MKNIKFAIMGIVMAVCLTTSSLSHAIESVLESREKELMIYIHAIDRLKKSVNDLREIGHSDDPVYSRLKDAIMVSELDIEKQLGAIQLRKIKGEK